MLQEFKEFALRGNVVDMAVGVIIGTAFGKIVTSLVNDIVMPPIGLLLGSVDFRGLFVNLGSGDYATLADAEAGGAPIVRYGAFINTVLDFVIVAFVIFLAVRAMNKLLKKQKEQPAPAAPPEPSAEVKLLTEIRDALKSR